MTTIKTKGLLFDMDGTLVNTIACVEKFWRRVCKEHGIDADQFLATVHGHPTFELLCKWFPESMRTREQAQKLELDCVQDTDGVHMVPGADMVRSLDANKWAIVTAATGELATTRLKQVGLPEPPHLVAAHSVERGKPFPDCYVLGASILGVSPEDTIVFEDSVNGAKAGAAAGSTVIGILTSTSEQKLREAGASYAVRDFNDIKIVQCDDGSLAITINTSA
ncbi:DL-glycerol-3-phosphatase [Coemansia sp. RSA 1933]|nr:DL-glycerol-3-phosphatase [Coemansia sp. RSA 1933]